MFLQIQPAVLLKLWALIQFAARSLCQVSCYYPNGDEASNDLPCKSDGGYSACCGSAHICLANGLCFDAVGISIAHGSCTDSTWESSECAQVCTNVIPNTGAFVQKCKDNSWCCGDFECCTDNRTTFTLNGGFDLQLRGEDLSSLGVLPSTTTITTTTTRTESLTETTTVGGGTTVAQVSTILLTGGTEVVAMCTQTVYLPTGTIGADSQSGTRAGEDKKDTVIVAAVLGIALAITLLLLLGALRHIFGLRRSTKAGGIVGGIEMYPDHRARDTDEAPVSSASSSFLISRI